MQEASMKAKIGVYVCECGPNIGQSIDIPRVLESIPALEGYEDVELVPKSYGLLCSPDGKEHLKKEIQENGYTHLVIAACSPRDHDSTFMGICKQAGLNPYLYKIINIREHCGWIIHDKDAATEKAIQYISGGISRVLYQSELFERQLEITPDVLVIGGGVAGIETALSLAGEDRKVYLVERAEELGGSAARFASLLPRQQGGADLIRSKIEAVGENEHIRVLLNTEVESSIGFLGNFEVVLAGKSDGEKTDIKVGAIVVATGCRMSDPRSFAGIEYADSDEVYTSPEVEKMNTGGAITLRSGEKPASVALVHCVGRGEKGYCSRVCCNYMMKIAGYFKKQSKETKVTEFFVDMCVPHKADQKFFDESARLGIDFKRVRKIGLSGTRVEFKGMDGKKQQMDFDMVVLASALEPSEGTEALAGLLEIDLDDRGFYREAHHTTDPVATSIDGIFVAGASQGPRDISDSILLAQASAGRIRAQLIPGGKIVPEVKVSEILEAYCTGCKTCLEVCGYGAIYFDDQKGISVVNEAVCRGCGNCFGSCPSGALRTKHFTNSQLLREVTEALK
jgi:heterodisulfide reductase subunit A